MKRPGQIVLFRFPQTDFEEGKLRPALLLGKLPGEYDDWLICMISSLRSWVSRRDFGKLVALQAVVVGRSRSAAYANRWLAFLFPISESEFEKLCLPKHHPKRHTKLKSHFGITNHQSGDGCWFLVILRYTICTKSSRLRWDGPTAICISL